MINPQWLADALAGVVTMVNQTTAVLTGGVVPSTKLFGAMSNKYEPNNKS